MNVSEAVASRASVRGFKADPVDGAIIRRVLEKAARAPSGGNLQPWHIDVVGGAALDELKGIMRDKLATGFGGEPAEYAIYPADLPSPYRDYRFAVGEEMYRALGIPREDKAARLRWIANNFQFFGAPLALFCTIGRAMGPPQWSDLGMYLQTVMLLLREEGLDSCAQEIWSMYPETIRGFLGTPDDRMLFCGMAIGYKDEQHQANAMRSARAPLADFATFRGL
jgi:nitroreductase